MIIYEMRGYNPMGVPEGAIVVRRAEDVVKRLEAAPPGSDFTISVLQLADDDCGSGQKEDVDGKAEQ